jgi:DNA-binding NtrC family response regulator
VRRVIVRGPEGRTECTFELDEASALLLGRAPDPETAPDVPDSVGRRIQHVKILAPSISTNHVLVWRYAEQFSVQDLGSKNGTWLLLPRSQTVHVDAPEIVLQLAQAVGETGPADEPAPSVWSGRRDFAPALATSIERWFVANGIDISVTVVTHRVEGSGPAAVVPLTTGEALEIVPLGTANAHWPRLVERVWRWVARQNSVYEAEEDTRREGTILASSVIRAAHREVIDAARSGARTLLLTGPSGAGKEKLAEVFHRQAGSSGPFVPVNCSMFNRELLRSELFGAEAGSFTGATRRIVGAVERAQGGTLFLDEIGDMPVDVQPMLLRFLDRREYEHLGQYGRTQRADVRVIAATNRDLRNAARTGGFRVDLWYRLSVHVVEVPPLALRWDDVLAYLDSVLMDGGRCSMREALSPAALDSLRAHAWEGNFRELTNFAQRLPRSAGPGAIDVTTCRRALERGALRPGPPPATASGHATTNWAHIVSLAIAAFEDDRGSEPRTWDEQKEWNEKYLKPLLFYHLSGAAEMPAPADDDALSSLASRTAARVQADRGTAAKQLARYFERFKG